MVSKSKVPKPPITVLMSVYNAEKYLKKAIESILNQTFSNFEFLIIDDGSEDRSLEIIKSYNDPRIRLIKHKTNQKLIYSLNEGLKLAKASLVARMDADDIAYPDRLEEQYDFLKHHKDYGLVFTFWQRIDGRGQLFPTKNRKYSPESVFYKLHFENCIPHPTVMFRKELVLRVGGYDKKALHMEDYALWFKLSKVTKIHQLRKILLEYRVYRKSITYTYREIQIRNSVRYVKRSLDQLCSHDLSEKEILSWFTGQMIRGSLSLQHHLFSQLRNINECILEKEKDEILRLNLNVRKIKMLMNFELLKILLLLLYRFALKFRNFFKIELPRRTKDFAEMFKRRR